MEHTGLWDMHNAHSGCRPLPWDDGIACPLETEHCGFSTREQLDWWFRGYKRVLYEYKFNIAFYLVASQLIRYGHRQIMFERGDLLPVERYPIVRNGEVLR